jgi:hypothetical protein
MHKMDERAPFDRAWIGDPIEFQRKKETYKKLFIKPVNTDHLLQQTWWDDLNLQDSDRLKEDIVTLAIYMHDRFVNAIKTDPRHALEIVDAPGPETFVLELALVQIKPTKPAVNIIGDTLGVFVPGGGLVKTVGSGSIAIEAVLRDGLTNEELVLFADREADKMAPISLNDYTWYGHAKEIIDDWADQYVELASTPLSHKVEAGLPFTLAPW